MEMIDARQTNGDSHGDAAAYLLGALDAAGRARFEAHVTGCPECFTELTELQLAADQLALSVPQVAPPAHVRQRLLLRAHLTAREAPAAPAEPVTETVRAAGVVAAVKREPWLVRAQRYSGALAAASLVVAMVSGAHAFGTQRQLTDASQRAEYASAQLNDALLIVSQPNMVARTLRGMGEATQATAKVLMTPDRNKAVVVAYSLPKLEQDESYQCWLTRQDDKRIDGGTFKPDGTGKAYWVVKTPETMARYRWMGVTKEKGKGSATPSGPGVLGGQL